MKRLARRWLLITLLCGSAAAGRAAAAEVRLTLSARETYVGLPLTARIEIEDADVDVQPEIAEISGVAVTFAGGPNRSSQMSIINGRMTQSVTTSYVYQLTPRAPGTYTIPPVDVRADGRTYRTDPVTFVAVRSETGDLTFVEVAGTRDTLYVGEPLQATLKIWIKPYVDRQYRVRLGESDMWSLVDLEASNWGLFTDALRELVQNRQRPRSSEVLRADESGAERTYYLYEIDRTIWPDRPGPLDPGDIHVVITYPTALARSDSLLSFGELRIARSRPVIGEVDVTPIEVKPIPAEGRPPLFNGAVGHFSIEALANPKRVSVGEPITLVLTIAGSGRLETLPGPDLPEIEPLTRAFRVPREPLAGQVLDGRKRFTQTIRARRDDVQEVPPIPFVYFDPQEGRFVTVHSDAIPLDVKPSDGLAPSEIVDADPNRPSAEPLVAVERGILANYSDSDDVLAQQAYQPGWGTAASLALPPLAFAATWFTQRRRRRYRRDQSLARRQRARRTALQTIDSVSHAGRDNLPATVAAALAGYVADRCNLPPGGLTRAETVQCLANRNIPEPLVRDVDALLRQCETLQYAGAASAADRELIDAATRCIDQLEKERLA